MRFPTFRPCPPAVLMSIALASPLAIAQASGPAAADNSSWAAGIGVNLKQKAYTGIGIKSTALPVLAYENQWLRFTGLALELKLPSSSPLSFALRARYAIEDGYEAGDAPILNGMNERKAGLWLGGIAHLRHDIAHLSADWAADASGHSKGQRIRLVAEKPMLLGSVQLAPRLAANWLDKNYVDYYYGVTPGEARLGRAAYTGQATVNTELGLRGSYALAPQQSIYLDLSATALGSGIKDSPLVGRSTETTARIGYLYRF